MGFIRQDFGTITIESRRESFYIHAGYGYEPEFVRLGDMKLGVTFVPYVGGDELRVVGQVIGETFVKPVGVEEDGLGRSWDPECQVIWTEDGSTNSEKKAEGSLAALWRDHLHPEFLHDDLDDLIAALEDLRESRGMRRVA